MAGPLALVGGDELHPGNEPQDALLAEAAADGPAYVMATAAARHRPELAAAHAHEWFARFGLDVVELPVRTKTQARSADTAALARDGTFFYLVGGDPGIVPDVLGGSPVWQAVVEAWLGGAALAGSSAGAMALGAWTLIRGRVPGDRERRYRDALGLVPNVAVLPHFATFGREWVASALGRPSVRRRHPPRYRRACGRRVVGRALARDGRRRCHGHLVGRGACVRLRRSHRRSAFTCLALIHELSPNVGTEHAVPARFREHRRG